MRPFHNTTSTINERMPKMKPKYKGKHFITLEDWTKEEINDLLEVSAEL